MKKTVVCFIYIFLALSAFAQELPRVAVVPFNPVGVSERDASVITSLFETALVQTESFNVIEQNQIADIMEAQAYTMTGCTDESCAIEVGKLLAAEQIILGELSSIGGKFILNAKIIDVQQGRNIKADKVEASGMGEMTGAAELLAFKLAGLTYTAGGAVQVAQAFGEALIETVPAGADIYVNGAKKGVSPDLITRLPLGAIRIEAKKGNLYAVRDITVTAETARISLQLEEQYGNLFIKSSEAMVDVYLDGARLGTLGSGFFDNLAVGDHTLELKGQDVYWSGNITLEAGKSTKVEAYPMGFGVLSYQLPDDAEAEVVGHQYRRIIRKSGTLEDIFAGRYTIRIIGDTYDPYEETIQIEKGKALQFFPSLVLSQSYYKRTIEESLSSLRVAMADEESDRAFHAEEAKKLIDDIKAAPYDFTDYLHLAEAIFKDFFMLAVSPEVVDLEELSKGGIGTVTLDMVEFGESVRKNILESPCEFEDLLERTDAALVKLNRKFKLQNLYEEKQAIEDRITLDATTRKTKTTGGCITLGVGAAGSIAAGIFAFLAESAYNLYLDQIVTVEAEILRDRFKAFDLVAYISAGAAVIGLGAGSYFLLSRPGEGVYTSDYAALMSEIAVLEAEVK